jgi:hypothetical protein
MDWRTGGSAIDLFVQVRRRYEPAARDRGGHRIAGVVKTVGEVEPQCRHHDEDDDEVVSRERQSSQIG